jgi:hypothetical protein
MGADFDRDKWMGRSYRRVAVVDREFRTEVENVCEDRDRPRDRDGRE